MQKKFRRSCVIARALAKRRHAAEVAKSRGAVECWRFSATARGTCSCRPTTRTAAGASALAVAVVCRPWPPRAGRLRWWGWFTAKRLRWRGVPRVVALNLGASAVFSPCGYRHAMHPRPGNGVGRFPSPGCIAGAFSGYLKNQGGVSKFHRKSGAYSSCDRICLLHCHTPAPVVNTAIFCTVGLVAGASRPQ